MAYDDYDRPNTLGFTGCAMLVSLALTGLFWLVFCIAAFMGQVSIHWPD